MSAPSFRPGPPSSRPRSLFALALAAVVLGSCSGGDASTAALEATALDGVAPLPPYRPLAGDRLGAPIPGLTDAQLAAFQRGKVVFDKRFTPAEGLGPLYNATSCASCHSTPVSGGSAQLYRNFYLVMIGVSPLQATFPDLPSPVLPAYGPHDLGGATKFDLETGRFPVPPDFFGSPVQVGQRNAIPIFGTGLFEFISNATILSHADPFDTNADGISGRANYDFGDLGRFGVKSQSNNVERFTRPPLFNQMGITSDPFQGSAGTVSLSSAPQGTLDPDRPIVDNDQAPDPEISVADLGDLVAFTRFLAPPARLPFNAEATQGEALFSQIRCTDCHIPSLPSSMGPVEAFTDLLLHDMGPGLADGMQFGSPQRGGAATGDEFRTQPLWGVSLHAPFLHDGRAATLYEAVDAHGGEAQASRDAFVALTPAEQSAVIAFLEHL